LKILVAGSGGREHAIALALYRNGACDITVVPGNPGTASFACNATGDITTIASDIGADLVVIGPETPLVEGVSDQLARLGIPCFGPVAACARLEGSKWFAKEVMNAAGVPTAGGRSFTSLAPAVEYMEGAPGDFVIKADGLAAGKGVFLPESREEAVSVLESLFGQGDRFTSVVVEERLVGREVSVMAICNGQDAVMLPPSRDHKRAFDGDRGPNTGGMGAVCPPPGVDEGFVETIRQTVILPVLREMKARGLEYRGVLYAGLMLTEKGPFVLEFNVRFGDPETQAVLPMIESDLSPLLLAASLGKPMEAVKVRPGASACVILASGGYPGSYQTGLRIAGVEKARGIVYHAGTAVSGSNLVTAGGRVLGVSATGKDLEEALERAYADAGMIHFVHKHIRKDIGRTL
jgi:phosphoribosylamine---glycine ligase